MTLSNTSDAPHRTATSKAARWVAYVPLAAGAMLLIGMAAIWLMPEMRASMFGTALGIEQASVNPSLVSFPGAFWPSAMISVPMLVFAWTMWQLHLLFRRLAAGLTFDRTNASLVSRAGLGFVAFGALGVVTNTIVVLLLTGSNPPGERVLSVGFSSASLGALAAGFAFWALGLVLREAADLADDQAQII